VKLRNEQRVRKVRVMIVELEGSRVVATKSISLYETNHAEVFSVVESALNAAVARDASSAPEAP
jgi:hypothetical protein